MLKREAYLSWLEVDLGAIVHNYRILRGLVSQPGQVFPVIKADAYGHGALETARALLSEGIRMFCVARVEEAVELREAGIQTPILVFGPPLAAQAEVALGYDLSISVASREHIAHILAAARANGRKARIHLKLDIGMGRLGCRPGDVLDMLRFVARHPELEVEGIMSHFPSADMKPPTITRKQIEVFAAVRREVLAAGFHIPFFHVANSAATLDYPEAHFDAVRTGISLYGQYPSAEVEQRVPLRPAMSMKTRVIFLKDVPAGVGLSYGHTFVTRRASRIATVPLGYADGYPRHASNRTVMLVRGARVPQVGRVCMDLVLLDVTDVPGVEMGDEVLAFGRSGGDLLPADAVAAAIGTIGYEMTTRVGSRLPRFYV
jgi:alanine racemase